LKRPATPAKHTAPAIESADVKLARLVRTSKLLDPIARRHWLAVLPYLSATDRRRLEELLQVEGPDLTP
jgi:hypothetical protein